MWKITFSFSFYLLFLFLTFTVAFCQSCRNARIIVLSCHHPYFIHVPNIVNNCILLYRLFFVWHWNSIGFILALWVLLSLWATLVLSLINITRLFPYLQIVTLTFNLWLPQSIGPLGMINMSASLMKMHIAV